MPGPPKGRQTIVRQRSCSSSPAGAALPWMVAPDSVTAVPRMGPGFVPEGVWQRSGVPGRAVGFLHRKFQHLPLPLSAD